MSTSTSWEDVYRVQTARITELERDNAALRVRLDAASKHSALAVTLLAQAQVELVETRHNLNKPKEVQL